MSLMTVRDYDRMLDLTYAAMQSMECGADSVWQVVCSELMDILDANIGGVFNVQWPEFGMSVAAWPTWTEKVNWNKPDFVDTHPLVHHYVKTGDTRPHTISDIATPREWRNSPACSSIKAALDGASHHLAIPLDIIDKPYRSLSIGRPGRDFTRREKSLVERLQPLLLALDRHLRTMSNWRDRHSSSAVVEASSAVAATELTPRELAVLTLLAEGLTAATIGRRLGITVHTVSKHQQNVYRKLGTSDRLACVLLARDIGILPPRSEGHLPSSRPWCTRSQTRHRDLVKPG